MNALVSSRAMKVASKRGVRQMSNHPIWHHPFNKKAVFLWTGGSVIIGTGAILFSCGVAQYKSGFWGKK